MNKSCVTRGKPFKDEGLNLYLRNTHLFTPSGGNLASLGHI